MRSEIETAAIRLAQTAEDFTQYIALHAGRALVEDASERSERIAGEYELVAKSLEAEGALFRAVRKETAK